MLDLTQFTQVIRGALVGLHTDHTFLFDNIDKTHETTFNYHFANILHEKMINLTSEFIQPYSVDLEYKFAEQTSGVMVNKNAGVGNSYNRIDIIIHRRGDSVRNNFAAFECKRIAISSADELVLKNLTREEGIFTNTNPYKFGVQIRYFINIAGVKHATIIIFSNGCQVWLENVNYSQ